MIRPDHFWVLGRDIPSEGEGELGDRARRAQSTANDGEGDVFSYRAPCGHEKHHHYHCLSLVQFSRSVLSDSL